MPSEEVSTEKTAAEEGKKVETPSMPYSYHTFLFPFVWKMGKHERSSMEAFCQVLSPPSEMSAWEEEVFDPRPGSRTKSFPHNAGDAFVEEYGAFQYFTEPARKLIFGQGKNGGMRRFVYHPFRLGTKQRTEFRSRESENIEKADRGRKSVPSNELNKEKEKVSGRYVIKKGKKKNDKNDGPEWDHVFGLVIQGVVLNVYDSGTAMLILELENWDYPQLDAVNKINEHGRRVCFPFLASEEYILTADEISIEFNQVEQEKEDFNATTHEEYNGKSIELSYVMAPLVWLLNGVQDKDKQKITGKYYIPDCVANASDKWHIRPLVDDRMFVCCIIRDNSAFKALRSWDASSNEYTYLSSCDTAPACDEEYIQNGELYKFLFIETSPTCQSRTMRKKIFERCVYDRWIDWGSLYGVTHHSIVCVTGEDDGLKYFVIRPFLTLYVEMVKIALLARGTILALSERASEVANNVSEKRDSNLTRIEELQERYVKAQSQIMLFEVTVQEQGVELYQMLAEQLYLKENKEALSDQMSNLREVAAIRNDRKERRSDVWMNLVVLVLTIVTTLDIFFEVTNQKSVGIGIAVIGCLVIFMLFGGANFLFQKLFRRH